MATSSFPPGEPPLPDGTLPSVARSFAAILTINTRTENTREFKAMATMISRELAITSLRVIEQSGASIGGTVTLWPLDAPNQSPITAAVEQVDVFTGFAVLRLATPWPQEVPTKRISKKSLTAAPNWSAIVATYANTEAFFLSGRSLGDASHPGGRYWRLTVSVEQPVAEVGGAPVMMGNELTAIMASRDPKLGSIFFAIPIWDILRSKATNTVGQTMEAGPDASTNAAVGAPPATSGDISRSDAAFEGAPESGKEGDAESRARWIDQIADDRFSVEVRSVLGDAERARTESYAERLQVEHILIALAGWPGRNGLSLLCARLGVDLVSVLQPGLALRTVDSEEPAENVPSALPAMARSAHRALVRAIQRADAVGSKLVEIDHLVFGALSVSKNAQVDKLNSMGITAEATAAISSEAAAAAANSDAKAAPRGAAGPRSYQAGYKSDDLSGTDLLDITEEVNALASVMAAREVEPPLSLGLFGDWGTGKSFFMHMLEARIALLSADARAAEEKSGRSAYCSNVLQITFNAWNYIDSDLWASLAAEIFEHLAAAIVAERDPTAKDSPEKRALALAAASSSQAVLHEAERKKVEAEEELKQTEERLADLQRSKSHLEAELTKGELIKGVVGFAIEDQDVKRSIDEVKKTLGIPETKAVASEIQAELLDLEGTWKTTLFTLKNGRNLWIWLAAPVCALALLWLASKLLSAIHIEGISHQVLAGLGGIAGFLAPFVTASQKLLKAIDAAQAKRNELFEKKRKERETEVQRDLGAVREKVKAAQDNVTAAQERVNELNEQLENMRADRQAADFIRARHQSTDYTQRLGTISRVRSDLKHLSTLLRDVKKEAQEEFEKEMKDRQTLKEKEREKEKKPKLFPQIDRIILYIDDLDRCKEETVVKVLQAVHLLLAFPLFVVVVGVDPRWLLYSLQQSSRAFQKGKGEDDNEAAEAAKDSWQSTPLNYLEKIFQIPFSLRPIGKTGFGKMVDRYASQELWAKHSRIPGAPSGRGAGAYASDCGRSDGDSGRRVGDAGAAGDWNPRRNGPGGCRARRDAKGSSRRRIPWSTGGRHE
jgi:hypothetical protein